jgi:Beta-glucan synthesis-associated protein SKN1/KRE6/Sbg1
MHGNTSINPFFYGTYLAETKPNEPVTRTKKQVFQADAVGVAHQLTPTHFEKPHTFRLEWQPGRGGRLDWYLRGPNNRSATADEADSEGPEWEHVYSLKDQSLKDLMGSQIPIEPTALIFNVAVSSTWGFPYDTPDWCAKCFDCDDPKCACSFYPGFCQMLRSGHTAMYIDHVRVYQSFDADAHVGGNHTLGCDPPDYPTKEWIAGHSYRYMRNPPFSYQDKHPLRPVQRGGGNCKTDRDCGGDVKKENLTAIYERGADAATDRQLHTSLEGRGKCLLRLSQGMFSTTSEIGKVCSCHAGFTGPHCMALDHFDESPSAYLIRIGVSPFNRIRAFEMPGFMLGTIIILASLLLALLLVRVREQKRERTSKLPENGHKRKLVGNEASFEISMTTGTSV